MAFLRHAFPRYLSMAPGSKVLSFAACGLSFFWKSKAASKEPCVTPSVIPTPAAAAALLHCTLEPFSSLLFALVTRFLRTPCGSCFRRQSLCGQGCGSTHTPRSFVLFLSFFLLSAGTTTSVSSPPIPLPRALSFFFFLVDAGQNSLCDPNADRYMHPCVCGVHGCAYRTYTYVHTYLHGGSWGGERTRAWHTTTGSLLFHPLYFFTPLPFPLLHLFLGYRSLEILGKLECE